MKLFPGLLTLIRTWGKNKGLSGDWEMGGRERQNVPERAAEMQDLEELRAQHPKN